MDIYKALIMEVTQTLSGWGEAFFSRLPHLVMAVLLLVASYFLGKLAKKGLGRALQHTRLTPSLQGLASRAAQAAVVAVAFLICLGLLDLEKPLTSLLAGAGVVGIAVGFAFQNSTANFIGSVTVALRRPFRIGDLVQLGDTMGTVQDIDMRITRLRTFQGQDVLIPNKEVIENRITNYSTGQRRVDVAVGVGYDSDLEHALEVTMEALRAVEGQAEGTEPSAFLTGFGGSSIDITARVWTDTEEQPTYMETRTRMIIEIKKAYDAAGLEIPFPIRTLGISGAVEELHGTDLLAAK